jgi:hypothetical protein
MMNISLLNRALFGASTLAMLVLGACNTDDTDEENPCAMPEVTLHTPSNGLEYQMYGAAGHGFYELQYGNNGFSLGSGTVLTASSQGTIGNMNNGTYDIYVRGNCGGDSWSDWNGPKSFIITGGSSSNCSVPVGINTYITYSTSAILSWSQSNAANYYQVQYGLTGFNFGSGTVVTVQDNYPTITGLSSGTVYDYYVRANCGGTAFSAWSGVNSFVTD